MSLEQCPECGNQVSSDAETCPKCAKPLFETNTFSNNVERLIAALLSGVIFAFGGFALGNLLPFTGGPLVRIAEPFSQLRIEVGTSYSICAGVLGLIVGPFIFFTPTKKRIVKKS